jgi:hypothetical protein
MTDKKRAHKVEWVPAGENSSYQIKRCKVCGKGFAMSPWPDDDKEIGDDCPGKAQEPEVVSG